MDAEFEVFSFQWEELGAGLLEIYSYHFYSFVTFAPFMVPILLLLLSPPLAPLRLSASAFQHEFLSVPP